LRFLNFSEKSLKQKNAASSENIASKVISGHFMTSSTSKRCIRRTKNAKRTQNIKKSIIFFIYFSRLIYKKTDNTIPPHTGRRQFPVIYKDTHHHARYALNMPISKTATAQKELPQRTQKPFYSN